MGEAWIAVKRGIYILCLLIFWRSHDSPGQ